MIQRAWITTNRNCNLKCEWCYAQNSVSRSLDLNVAKKIISNLHELGIKNYALIGGEPTIYRHFFELISYLQSFKASVFVTSNGIKFSDKDFAKSAVNAGLSGVDISIKGLTEDEYIKNTRSKGLDCAVVAYRNLTELGIPSSVSYVFTVFDKKRIELMLDMLQEKELNRVYFQFVKPVVGEENSQLMSCADMGKCVDELFFSIERKKEEGFYFDYKVEVSFPICLIKNDVYEKLKNEKRITTCCHIQKGTGIIFDTDMTVIPCNHFANYPFIDDKPILEIKDIIELWKSKEVNSFRQVAQRYPSIKCSSCYKWSECGGGCFTRWLSADPHNIIPGLLSE